MPESTGSTKKCPYCAETIQAEANICRFCGKDIRPAIIRAGELERKAKAWQQIAIAIILISITIPCLVILIGGLTSK